MNVQRNLSHRYVADVPLEATQQAPVMPLLNASSVVSWDTLPQLDAVKLTKICSKPRWMNYLIIQSEIHIPHQLLTSKDPIQIIWIQVLVIYPQKWIPLPQLFFTAIQATDSPEDFNSSLYAILKATFPRSSTAPLTYSQQSNGHIIKWSLCISVL